MCVFGLSTLASYSHHKVLTKTHLTISEIFLSTKWIRREMISLMGSELLKMFIEIGKNGLFYFFFLNCTIFEFLILNIWLWLLFYVQEWNLNRKRENTNKMNKKETLSPLCFLIVLFLNIFGRLKFCNFSMFPLNLCSFSMQWLLLFVF